MKATLTKAAVAVGAVALASCSTNDFSDKYGNADPSGTDRKNEYTQMWIDRFGLFDKEHDWTTLESVDAEITQEYGSDIEAHIYNADPEQGGHLIGFSRQPGRLVLDLPKDAASVYAVIMDGKGETLLAGEFDVALRSVAISSSRVHEQAQSRSAHEVSYFDAMVVCEDLGGIGDYDFNDVVLGLRHVAGTNTLKIMPMAAGGTLHADVYYGDEHIGEIHDLISAGSDVTTMLNTERFDKVSRLYNVTVPAGFRLSRDWKNIRLAVKDSGETISITGPEKENEAPQMFCLGGDWYWPKETVGIDNAYPGFTSWTTSMLNAAWADAYSDISRVVVWDVSQVVPNWFSGVTADGATYRARIGGATNVDVKSGEVYSLEPPTSLANMFSGASTLTELDVAADHFDTSLADNLSGAFQNCSGLTALDLSNWDTGNVTNMRNMFSGCTSLTDLSLSGFNTEEVKDVNNMFNNCSSLRTLDISDWDISNVTNSSGMFTNCNVLETVTMNRWVNTSTKSNLRNMLATLPSSVKTLVMHDCDLEGTLDLGEMVGYTYYGLFNGMNSLTTLDVTGWNTPDLTALRRAFSGCAGLESITGINTWDVPKMTSLEETFQDCNNLKSLDLSNWATDNVKIMRNMFKGCSSLTDLNLGGMNTSNVTDVSYMFNGCASLNTLDISGWDISNVRNSSKIFENCDNLEKVTMNNWANTSTKSNLRNMLATLPSSVNTLILRYCDFEGTSDLGEMVGYTYNGIFHGLNSLTTLDVTGWNTPDLTTLLRAFSGCAGLETITGINTWDVPKVTRLDETFKECTNLRSLDLSNWATGNVTTMKDMFKGCTSLTDLNLSGMNTSNVTEVSYMFQDCASLKTLDISGWDISKMNYASGIFKGCDKLESVTMNNWTSTKSRPVLSFMLSTMEPSVKTLVMRDCDFAEVTDLGRMDGFTYCGTFDGCESLSDLDVTGWNTRALTTLQEMFDGCTGLESITGIHAWNVSNVKNMQRTFRNCSSLTNLDLSMWTTGNITDMSYMFAGCTSLTSVNLSGMDTANLTNASYMFNGCSSLQILDISTWDISNVTSFSNMLYGCPSDITIKCTSATRDKLIEKKSSVALPANVQWVIVD